MNGDGETGDINRPKCQQRPASEIDEASQSEGEMDEVAQMIQETLQALTGEAAWQLQKDSDAHMRGIPQHPGIPPLPPREPLKVMLTKPPGLGLTEGPVEVNDLTVCRPKRAVEVQNADAKKEKAAKPENGTDKEELRKVCITRDSGAGDFFCGKKDFPEFLVRESVAAKASEFYTGPKGSIIDNEGGKLVEISAEHFASLGRVLQVCENVNKPFASAGQAANAGFASRLDEPHCESFVQLQATKI